MSTQVFRKTEAGREELKLRRAGLPLATRQVLILVNGVDDARALMAKGLADVRSHLDMLVGLELIEPVPGAAPPASSLADPVVAPTVSKTSAPERPASPAIPQAALPDGSSGVAKGPLAAEGGSVDAQAALASLQRQLLATLSPHFGPDAADVAKLALTAGSVVEFNRALDAVETKLSIYMGRKRAARELQALRQPG
ncbi:MAG TPA: hypothetical protein VIN35_02100 [Hydrogenophaga sp.]